MKPRGFMNTNHPINSNHPTFDHPIFDKKRENLISKFLRPENLSAITGDVRKEIGFKKVGFIGRIWSVLTGKITNQEYAFEDFPAEIVRKKIVDFINKSRIFYKTEELVGPEEEKKLIIKLHSLYDTNYFNKEFKIVISTLQSRNLLAVTKDGFFKEVGFGEKIWRVLTGLIKKKNMFEDCKATIVANQIEYLIDQNKEFLNSTQQVEVLEELRSFRGRLKLNSENIYFNIKAIELITTLKTV
jgi:hypothetical protein